MNSRVEIDFKIFNNQCETQKRTKIGVHELFYHYMQLNLYLWQVFFLLTWISFSAISLDSLDKMLKTQPKSTCE